MSNIQSRDKMAERKMKHVLDAGIVSLLFAWLLVGIAGLAGLEALGTWLATTPLVALFSSDPAAPLATEVASIASAVILFLWVAVALALITAAAALHRSKR